MNPYPGLRPFRPEEANVFAGREVFHHTATTRIRVSPLTLLVARSGVGKSSFLTCRLMPFLGEESTVRYRNEWGQRAAHELIRSDLEALIGSAPRGDEAPVLVLDQFEDVFKLSQDRAAIWDMFAELVNVSDPAAHCVVSMREEWLGAWSESTDFLPDSFNSVLRLAPLNARELVEAIRRPAVVEGTVSVEDDFASALLLDLKRPSAFGHGETYVEPGTLQLVCRRMWDAASVSSERRLDLELYEKLGRADTIVRDFVWNELGSDANNERFDSADRILWAGMTRHLVVAQGVKAIASPLSMAKRLRLEDLGFAGPAVVHKRCSAAARKYLTTLPDSRENAPSDLVAWIASVLDAAASVGFLKRQGSVTTMPAKVDDETLVELSHDMLGDVFRQFSVELETWVRGRWAKMAVALFGLVFVTPYFLLIWFSEGFLAAILLLAAFALGLFVYLVVILLVFMIGEFFFRLIGYPIVRRLAKGVVPRPRPAVTRSRLRRYLSGVAGRFGFAASVGDRTR
jgi:hypothetical protein